VAPSNPGPQLYWGVIGPNGCVQGILLELTVFNQ
jgi:hypothetical protein